MDSRNGHKPGMLTPDDIRRMGLGATVDMRREALRMINSAHDDGICTDPELFARGLELFAAGKRNAARFRMVA